MITTNTTARTSSRRLCPPSTRVRHRAGSTRFGATFRAAKTRGNGEFGAEQGARPLLRSGAHRLTGLVHDRVGAFGSVFVANGGDGFTRLTAGTSRVTAPGFDIDALVAYLGSGTPVAPGPQNRITKLG